MTKIEANDDDVAGCVENGRKTSAYNLKPAAYRSLRNGKKAKRRRVAKRRARKQGQKECDEGKED